MAGCQRLRGTRPGAGLDVHPQGRGPAVAPRSVPSGQVGRYRPRLRRPGGLRSGSQHLPRLCRLATTRLRPAATAGTRYQVAERDRAVAAGIRCGQRVRRRAVRRQEPGGGHLDRGAVMGPAWRASGGHPAASRHARRAGTAGPRSAGGPLSAGARRQPVAAADAGHADPGRGVGAVA